MTTNNPYVYQYMQCLRKMLGERLTDLMKFRGVSRSCLIGKLKTEYGYPISRQTLHKYECGTNWIPEDFAINVGQILKINPLYLLDPRIEDVAYERWKDNQEFMADFQDVVYQEDKRLRGEI